MPARQFFAVLKAGRKREFERASWLLYEATSVAVCAQADEKFIKKLQRHYKSRFEKAENQPKYVDNNTAGAILTSLLGGRVH